MKSASLLKLWESDIRVAGQGVSFVHLGSCRVIDLRIPAREISLTDISPPSISAAGPSSSPSQWFFSVVAIGSSFVCPGFRTLYFIIRIGGTCI